MLTLVLGSGMRGGSLALDSIQTPSTSSSRRARGGALILIFGLVLVSLACAVAPSSSSLADLVLILLSGAPSSSSLTSLVLVLVCR
jgi:hypothetical protein